MIVATFSALWIFFSSWSPTNTLELAAVIIFFGGHPLGGFWMIYRAIRYERRPVRYVVLAFVPLSFLWYYVERVRKSSTSTGFRAST
jgi:hypothetical protein